MTPTDPTCHSGRAPDESYEETTADMTYVPDEPDDHLPSSGLLSFYDRLRTRVITFAENSRGTLSPKVIEALLIVPDVFILLLRLSLDPNVPKASRALIGTTLAYFVLPVDILPEALLGPVGYMDDLVLALTVMSRVFSQDLERYTAHYWSGSESLRHTIGDILSAAQGLLSADVYNRLKDLLANQGIDLDRAREEAL